jgi:hypothetical protein
MPTQLGLDFGLPEEAPVITAKEARAQLDHIILRTSTSGLSFDEGKALAEPLLKIINAKGAEIAKRHKKSYRPLTWAYALRLGV